MSLPVDRSYWLTSFWGFEPGEWGGLGFPNGRFLENYIVATRPGSILAVYVTKAKGPLEMRGKLVGFMEISHDRGDIDHFISGRQRAIKEADPERRGRWKFAVRATRAWRVIPEDYKDIEDVLPLTYRAHNHQFLGSQGAAIDPSDLPALWDLNVIEVPIYGVSPEVTGQIVTFGAATGMVPAVPPAQKPYWVGETDGPKHLYILKLSGNIAEYLGCSEIDLDERMVIKVGLSRSPLSRRDQIQSAYPDGTYKWEIMFPKPLPSEPPYPNFEIARVGEDAMKHRLIADGAKWLQGEFYLASEGLIYSAWTAGRVSAEQARARQSEQILSALSRS